jgi:hypothetical protein
MGSRHYADRCRQRGENVVAMICPETIGCYFDEPGTQRYPFPWNLWHPSTGNFVLMLSNVRSRRLGRELLRRFRHHSRFPARAAAVPQVIPRIGWSDDWAFWRAGYRAVTVTDTAYLRYRHYHEPTDTPGRLHYPKMAEVVRGLAGALADLARVQ